MKNKPFKLYQVETSNLKTSLLTKGDFDEIKKVSEEVDQNVDDVVDLLKDIENGTKEVLTIVTTVDPEDEEEFRKKVSEELWNYFGVEICNFDYKILNYR